MLRLLGRKKKTKKTVVEEESTVVDDDPVMVMAPATWERVRKALEGGYLSQETAMKMAGIDIGPTALTEKHLRDAWEKLNHVPPSPSLPDSERIWQEAKQREKENILRERDRMMAAALAPPKPPGVGVSFIPEIWAQSTRIPMPGMLPGPKQTVRSAMKPIPKELLPDACDPGDFAPDGDQCDAIYGINENNAMLAWEVTIVHNRVSASMYVPFMSREQEAPPGDMAFAGVPDIITKMCREAHAGEEQVAYDKWQSDEDNADLEEMDWY